jgi:uncharacterized protein (DUF58 family)
MAKFNMNAQIKELLKPEILNSINGLELIARIIVEGFMSGSNKSQSIGTGQEFSQYRNYEPGDDLRQLDWKMYARSERYFIKQAEIETNITVKFMIDASHSMSYSEDYMSKLQYAKIVTAALAYLARKQSDTFGLFTVNDKNIHVVQPRFEQQQFMRFLNELILVKSEGTWKKGASLEHLFDRHGKEMIIFISDLYDEESDLLDFISRLKTRRNEVIVFHIMGEHEMKLDFDGFFTFQDLETKTIRKIDTRLQQKQYGERVSEWIQQSRLWMYERQISYQLVLLSDPFENALRDFLKMRKMLVR